MSRNIKLRKGFDINLVGKAEATVEELPISGTYAIKPTDFQGYIKPKVLVAEGDRVKAGQPLYFDKSVPSVQYTSPVSGEVVEVRRGEKRRLLEIIVKADSTIEYEEFKTYSVSDINNLSREEAQESILKSGIWPNFMQRPYAVIANPEETPKAIFISAFDSSPLAPDYSILFKGQEEAFKAGIEILKKFSKEIHVNLSNDREISPVFTAAKGVEINKFSGPHPSGNVGVQIHHINPINKGDIAWTVSPIGVIQLGKLFLEGKYDASKVIALTGSEVTAPKYYKTIGGVAIETLTKGKISGDQVRIISGNILSGEKVEENTHLGYYHNQVTVIPEGNHGKFFGSFAPDTERPSLHRAFGLFSFLNGAKKEYTVNSNLNGERRPHVFTGVMEKVLPMDILPVYLLKAIETEDYDEMEALGIYEVAEEDFALCEFVDVSKHDVQKLIRTGIELMQNS